MGSRSRSVGLPFTSTTLRGLRNTPGVRGRVSMTVPESSLARYSGVSSFHMKISNIYVKYLLCDKFP